MNSSLVQILLIVGAPFFAFIFGCCFYKFFMNQKAKSDQINSLKYVAGINKNTLLQNFLSTGINNKILNYFVIVSYKIRLLNKQNIFFKFVKCNTLPPKMKEICIKSNMPKDFGNYALKYIQLKFVIAFVLCGTLIGIIFSYFLVIILVIIGVYFGYNMPKYVLKKEVYFRTNNLDKSLPEMLDVVSLGLRSGLTFDRSLKIYTKHFNNAFSKECAVSQQKWESGLCSREESLRLLANTYNSHLLFNVVESTIRSIRFGSSLVSCFEESAAEARCAYKEKQEEIVSKAPVKMMFPTGALILPAMLILVLGPVLLELIKGF